MSNKNVSMQFIICLSKLWYKFQSLLIIVFLRSYILRVLQEAGGQLERSEIKERISDLDDQIAEYAEIEKKSKKTGNVYKEFNFKFNFISSSPSFQ